MEKKRYFRGFLASLFVLFFTGTALAEGYTCPDFKQYTSCNAGYYLNGVGVGNACIACDSGYSSPAENTDGATSCTKECTINCTPLECPANATCDIGNETRTGTENQVTKTCSADAFSCSITISCNPSFYKNDSNTCSPCDIGQYSAGNATSCSACTGLPANAEWSGNGTSATSCSWACKTGYHKNDAGTACESDCNPAKACSTLGGEWTGTYNECTGDQASKCSKSCSVACSGNDTDACPTNASCTYDTTKTYTGTQYYGGSCNASGTCPVKIFTCNDGYTKTSDGTACTEATYEISYVLNNGTQASSGVPTSYKYRTGATINGIPTRSGYTFAGWCTDSGLNSCAMTQTISTTATGDKTFYAKWTQCTPCAAGVGASCSLAVTDNACVYTTSCLSGYSGIANNGKYNPTCCTASCSGVTGYTLGSYNACNGETDGLCYRNCNSSDVPGGTTFTGTVNKNGTSTCRATACDTNHCLSAAGVCLDKPLNGACSGNPSEPIKCNDGYDLSSNGLSCEPKTYTVTYSCGDGSGDAPAVGTARYNTSFTPVANTCTRADWVFNGWLISGTDTVKQPGANFTWRYLENKTFTAQWIQTAGNCTSGQYYDETTTTCKTCPSEYPKSDLGATSEAQCYKEERDKCTKNIDYGCINLYNASSCVFDTYHQVTCRRYKSAPDECRGPDGTTTHVDILCPATRVTCPSSNYFYGTLYDGECKLCSENDSQYINSSPSGLIPATSENGNKACFKRVDLLCTPPVCPPESTGTCDYDATDSKAGGGRLYYGTEEIVAGSAANYTCPAHDGGPATWTCKPGYDKNINDYANPYEPTPEELCVPHVYTITLDANGGSGDATIYQKYSVGWFSDNNATAAIDNAPLPTRTNWTFLGYFTATSGGEKIIDADGALPVDAKYTENVTLYAQWSQNTTDCQPGKYYNGSAYIECPIGSYCPGEGSSLVGTAGCAVTCPPDAAGGVVSSAAGSSASTACYTVRMNQPLADNSGRGDQKCFYKALTSDYSNTCTINITACEAGYWREQENSTTCSSTDIGEYSPTDDLDKHLCTDLRGAADNVTTAAKNSTAATDCYNPCGNIGIENGTRVPVNAKEFYNGTQIPVCSYTTSCNAGYRPNEMACVPNVYTVTLNHDNGTANSTIYLKYADGWYSNEAATSEITSVAIPANGDGKTFEAYTSTNGDVVVNSDGVLTTNYTIFTANATITATYGNRESLHCDAGTYYTGDGTSCTQCPANSYCPGVDTFVGVGSPRGINTCASLNGTYTHADGTSATVIGSAAGAGAATDCYATNVAYTSTTNKATGSQTCYFNEATTDYTNNCKDKRVLSCVGGYWLENSSDTDCIAVGIGYYSAPGAKERNACPNLDADLGVKTFSETSEDVTKCYLGNIWYQGTHSGHRRSCYHTADADDTNVSTGYNYNCDVSIIVTCDAGYYDDGAYKNDAGERDCKPITDKDSFSPAQSYFTDEPAQPNQETPGSSTKLHSCPETKPIDNGMAQRVFNTPWVASDYAVCEYKAAACDTGYRPLTSDTSVKCVWADPDTCPQGFYCPEGSDEPIECPTDKNGIAATTEIGARTIEQCFIKYDPYSAFQNGTGSATCNYSNASRDYTNCHDIEAKTCNAGYYYRDSGSATCVGVVSGNYSPEPDIVQTPCPTGGSGSNQFAANWDACYKNCETTVAHSETVVAKIEKVFGISANAYATCEFHVTCEAGYSPTNNDTTNPTCGACPEGSYCESGNEEPTACPATHPYSAPNMTSVTGCYEKCEEYKLDGGTAIPRAEKVNYPARCEFYGISDRGNPCDIIDGTCIESSCSGDFEMIDGRCEPCNRENALAYKTIGNCMVASCINGFHPNGDKCESNVRECQAPNATIAEQRWDFTKNSFGTCTIVECDYGYHVASNACVADERVCAVEHGTGTQEWNSATNSWSECVATSCEPGYTNDPYETNEHTKQCGQCKNKFRVHGEQAASTYIQGCEIASCMYQGELYNLENNECVPICSIEGKEDETGTMKWDPVRKKCVRTCKEGYTMW